MNLLVDTAALFLLATDPDRVPWETREVLSSPDNEVYYSSASVWEASQALAQRKLSSEVPLDKLFKEFQSLYHFQEAPCDAATFGQLAKLEGMPGSQFDKIVAATATALGAAIVSPKPVFGSLPVRVVW